MRKMNSPLITRASITGLVIGLLVIPFTPPTMAKEAVAEVGKVDRCLSLQRIKHTKAVDNQTIVVEMRGSDGWRKIETASRCPGLKFEDSFSYATSLNKLCKGDIITVLGGIGSRCGLAQITIIGAAEADRLIAKK